MRRIESPFSSGTGRRQLRMESLEARCMLTGTGEAPPEGIYYNDNVLTISGSEYHDHALVRLNAGAVEASLETSHDLGTLQETYQQSGPQARVVNKIVFYGKNGDDLFENETHIRSEAYGGRGHDTLVGGSAKDTFYGDFNDPSLSGYTPSLSGYGNDNLFGGGGDDILQGGPGNDHIRGEGGDDTLKGEDGNDELYGGDATDTIFGGYGHDLASGGQGKDLIDGEAGYDKLWGGPGDDTLLGRNGHDWLFGDSGDDKLVGGYGRDNLYGDSDVPSGITKLPFDYYLLPAGPDGDDTLHGGGWADKLDGGGGDDLMFGGTGWDRLWGGEGHDELHGGEGTDTLLGCGGNDLLSGGDGTDYLYGHEGNDALDGGAAVDYLYGGWGNDVLYGGFDLVPDHIGGFVGADIFLASKSWGWGHIEFRDCYPALDGDIALYLDQALLDALFGWTNRNDPYAHG